jgi:hypothetical protein
MQASLVLKKGSMSPWPFVRAGERKLGAQSSRHTVKSQQLRSEQLLVTAHASFHGVACRLQSFDDTSKA